MAATLTEAVNAVDLPRIVFQLFPESGARPGVATVVRAVWRGDEHPSFSLYRSSAAGIWMFKDQATGDQGTSFHFLTSYGGMTKQTAATYLMNMIGVAPFIPSPRSNAPAVRNEGHRNYPPEGLSSGPPTATPQGGLEALSWGAQGSPEASQVSTKPVVRTCPAIPIEADRLDKLYATYEHVLTVELKDRGFNESDRDLYGLMAANRAFDGILPITDPDGIVVALKRRIGRTQEQRYKYEVSGHGSPAWASPGFREAMDETGQLFLIEGELNAMIAHAVLTEYSGVNHAVLGIAGATNHPYGDIFKERKVWVYADGDEAGLAASQAWAELAIEQEADSVHSLPALPKKLDFCDVAGQYGRERLFKNLEGLKGQAVVLRSSDDRQIGFSTVSELMSAADRYMSGVITNPSGFHALDKRTLGMPTSGIVLICALPSMGKSVFLRNVLMHHVDQGGKILLFTPDQNVPSVMRMLASHRSGIPGGRVARGKHTSNLLKKFGSPEGIARHWREVYDDTVLHYSKRFTMSEIQYLPDVRKAIVAGLDEGVTMFGGDYLQSFDLETDDNKGNSGRSIREFKEGSREWKAPIVFAVQLAKYKFNAQRKSGVPYSNDIEGVGQIYQAAEMAYFLYTHYVYTQEYPEYDITPETEYFHLGRDVYIPKTRIYVRKNKEDERGFYESVLWDREVPTFRNIEDKDDYVSLPLLKGNGGLYEAGKTLLGNPK